MYKGSCSCQAIQLELSGVSEREPDVETLSCSDNSTITLNARREDLIIDCAPDVLGEVAVAPNHKQVFCNICSTPIFTENGDGTIALHVHFYGHDLLAHPHSQYHIP